MTSCPSPPFPLLTSVCVFLCESGSVVFLVRILHLTCPYSYTTMYRGFHYHTKVHTWRILLYLLHQENKTPLVPLPAWCLCHIHPEYHNSNIHVHSLHKVYERTYSDLVKFLISFKIGHKAEILGKISGRRDHPESKCDWETSMHYRTTPTQKSCPYPFPLLKHAEGLWSVHIVGRCSVP